MWRCIDSDVTDVTDDYDDNIDDLPKDKKSKAPIILCHARSRAAAGGAS